MSIRPPKTTTERAAEMSGEIMDEELASNRIIDGVVVNKDGSMGVGFRITPSLLTTASESGRTQMHAQVRTLLNSLEDKFDIQVIWQQNHRDDAILHALDHLQPQMTVLQRYTTEQTKMLRSRLASGDLRVMDVIVILMRKCTVDEDEMKKRGQKFLSDRAADEQWGREAKWYEKFKFFFEKLTVDHLGARILPASFFALYTDEEFSTARQELLATATFVSQSLHGCGYKPKLLGDREAVEIYYQFWAPCSYDAGNNPRNFDPQENLPLTDIYLTSPFVPSPDGTFKLDGQHHGILTLDGLPETLRFVMWEEILLYGGFSNLRIIMNCRRGDPEKRKRKLNSKLGIALYESRKDRTRGQQIEDLKAELEEIGRDVEKTWRGSVTFHLHAKTAEAVLEEMARLKLVAGKQQGLKLVEEVHGAWDYWRGCQPFWTRDFDAARTYDFTTSQVVCLMPLIAETTLLDRPVGALLETTGQSIYNFSPFDEGQFSSYSMMVVGGTGSGKSFVVIQLLLQWFRARKATEEKNQPRVVIVDLGNSFRNLCECVNGSYTDMDINLEENTMNPVYFRGDRPPAAEELSARLFFLEKLMAEEGKRVKREDMSVVEEALLDLISANQGREFLLEDLQNLLRKKRGGEDLAKMLSLWTTGRYKRIFNARNSRSLANPFTVFDLSKVVDNKDVLPVMFASIVSFVMEMGRTFPHAPKVLIFDEAWRVLQDPVMGAFIESCYRALRKLGFCVISMSQSIEEFVNSGSRTAITGNLVHKLILKQNSAESAAALAAEFSLTEAELAIIQRLQTMKGEYSQALLHHSLADGQSRSHLVVCRPTPLSYAIATTNHSDRREFARLFEQLRDYQKAVDEFARLYPSGVSADAAPEPEKKGRPSGSASVAKV